LPRKVLKIINNKSVLQHVLDAVKKAKLVDEVVIAAPHKIPGFEVFTPTDGTPEADVLARYYQCAKRYKATVVVRVTSDCPMLEGHWIDVCLKARKKWGYDYVTNRPYAPDGMDVECFTMRALEEAYRCATSPYDREHVTPYIQKNMYTASFEGISAYKNLKLSLDTKEDLKTIRRLMRGL